MNLEAILFSAVMDAAQGEGPVAVQLSGGLDSAIIQAIGKFDRLYCCTFPDDGVDNMPAAILAAQGKEVVPVTFTREDLISVLPAVKGLTCGKGTWSQVCQWFLCRRAAEDGAKIVLTGEGADELFGGYARYKILHHIEQAFSDPKLEEYQGIIKHLFGDRRAVLINMLSRNMPRWIVEMAAPKNPTNLVKDAAAIEFDCCLPALLDHGAAMAEAHGLSCRFPFMDPAVVEYANSLEPSDMVSDEHTKVALRRAAARLGVHQQIVNEKTKKGLFVPPSWAPLGSPKWSRGWFEQLMEAA
jgi:asparagine synthase (glutamine-hydrolysing)